MTAGETARHDELIYDFYGFPEELYGLQYPAPGTDDLVQYIEKLLGYELPSKPNRGLDHGVWVPLFHFWPDADVPIVQLSLPVGWSNKALFELGEKLAPLSEDGIAIIGSGAVTHNLRRAVWSGDRAPEDWAVQFDKWTTEVIKTKDKEAILNWEEAAPEAKTNHPTPDHFRPLLVAAGAGWDRDPSFPRSGFEYGNFSLLSMQWG